MIQMTETMKEMFVREYESKFDATARYASHLGAVDPRECAQAAWAKAWEHLEDCREPEHFMTWMHTIVRNVTYGDHRKYGKLKEMEDYVELDQIPGNEDCFTQVANKLRDERVERRINALPGTYRDVIRLKLEGREHCEICNMTGLTLANVKSRIHRGTKMLLRHR
jgi:RNA polymerase sigma-70 factor, ECF subfamily